MMIQFWQNIYKFMVQIGRIVGPNLCCVILIVNCMQQMHCMVHAVHSMLPWLHILLYLASQMPVHPCSFPSLTAVLLKNSSTCSTDSLFHLLAYITRFFVFFLSLEKWGVIFQFTPSHSLLMGNVMPSSRNVQPFHSSTSPPPRSVLTYGIPQPADRSGGLAAFQLHPVLWVVFFFVTVYLSLLHVETSHCYCHISSLITSPALSSWEIL